MVGDVGNGGEGLTLEGKEREEFHGQIPRVMIENVGDVVEG